VKLTALQARSLVVTGHNYRASRLRSLIQEEGS
jgi:hypothetical protein